MTGFVIAQVIVDVSNSKVDKPFDYSIPHAMQGILSCGAKVIVPFRNRKVVGYVVGLSNETNIDKGTLKSIYEIVLDAPIIPKDLINLAFWMSRKYICPVVECLKAILPKGVEGSGLKRYIRVNSSFRFEEHKISSQKLDILNFLNENYGSSEYEAAKVHFATTYNMNSTSFSRFISELSSVEAIYVEAELQKAKVGPKYVKGLLPAEGVDISTVVAEIGKKKPAQAKLLQCIESIMSQTNEAAPRALAQNMAKTSAATTKALVDAHILKEVELRVERDPFEGILDQGTIRHKLTEEQSVVVDAAISAIDNRQKDVLLVHGVTGSGKTEIYLRILEHVLSIGQKGILMVPDIALTPQMVDRVKARFGPKVAILHSALGQGERYDQWMRAISGDCDVVVGVRSAVFAPMDNLGVIIVDEEHDSSYKQSDTPRYSAREVACERAKEAGAIVVLGSATPSVETYYKAQIGEYKLLELLKRVDDRRMPEIHVVDMRNELKTGNRSLFSRKLTEAIWDRLEKKEQIILFINRRGYSTFVMCRDCGQVVSCPNCDVSLVYHAKDKEMTCHYCDHSELVPTECAACESKKIKYFGAGTERVEEEVKKVFGDVKILRMDLDTTRKKGSHRKILEDFRAKKADILIGTQMIAKGLDIPNITLVGVVAADTALNLPDFRAAERTFQIISQVSGRSGRGTTLGEVVVQTYSPDHYGIVCACTNDYVRFYNYEMESRTAHGYPPICEMVRFLLASEDETLLLDTLDKIKALLIKEGGHKQNSLDDALDALSKRPEDGTLGIMGPIKAPIPKIDKKYRWHMLIKSTSPEVLYEAVNRVVSSLEVDQKVNLFIYFDPQSIL